MLLDFSYCMDLEFSDPVKDQYFALQCIPRDTDRQRLVELSVNVRPDTNILMDVDGLGNHKLYGSIRDEHDDFCLTVNGRVETCAAPQEEYEDPASPDVARYAVATPFTMPGVKLREAYANWFGSAPKGAYDSLTYFSRLVHDELSYAPGTTDVLTTAEEAFCQGSGVCQDYAHILIAILRLAGIPARYVTGLIPGEGESHAWVEANCQGYWYGFDPTNDLLVNESYIKFCHGRDCEDCMVSRGIFSNPLARQTMKITANVEIK